MNRCTSSIRIVAAALAGLLLLAACDTGDGKQLKPYDPADYPSQTIPPTSVPGTGDADGDRSFDGDVGGGIGSGFDDGAQGAAGDAAAAPFSLTAPWLSDATIDLRYTCDGADTAPSLTWSGVPAGTVEMAISMVDDSAVSDGQPFVHWVIGGLDPASGGIADGDIPDGSVQAINFFGNVGYDGPCPPPGDAAHLYRLTAHALDRQLDLADGLPATEFLEAIGNSSIDSTDVAGFLGR